MSDYLIHHGVKGMKWGVRHDYVPVGRNRGVQSVNGNPNKRKGLSDRQKRALKIGAAAVGTGLVTYGAYKMIKSGIIEPKALESGVLDTLQKVGGRKNIGKSARDIDMHMVGSINSANIGTFEGTINCTHTTSSYILNSVLGKNTTALGFNGVDEVSGFVAQGRNIHIFESIFDNVKNTELNPNAETLYDFPSLREVARKLPSQSTGILYVNGFNPTTGVFGHVINYEKNKTGATTFIDPQTGGIVPKWNSIYRGVSYFDCSNASISKDGEEILKKMVKGL